MKPVIFEWVAENAYLFTYKAAKLVIVESNIKGICGHVEATFAVDGDGSRNSWVD